MLPPRGGEQGQTRCPGSSAVFRAASSSPRSGPRRCAASRSRPTTTPASHGALLPSVSAAGSRERGQRSGREVHHRQAREFVMGSGVGIRQVGYFDCAGGGQVVVDNNIAYVAHMRSPHGTSIIDVSDPKNPKDRATLGMPQGAHSHKVGVGNGVMVVNHEINHADTRPPPADFRGGLGIYDVSKPRAPRPVKRWETVGSGVHRFEFDGRYAYMSPTLEGYVGNVAMIMDLKDPANPTEVGRWWMPGQWLAGGEKPSWDKTAHRCHHPLRLGNRLYTSYWFGGFVILDIDHLAT